MVGTLDFQVKTLVFGTWLGQCVVFSWAKHFTFTVPLSPPPQEYEWVPEKANKILVGWVGKGRE